ncbi:MAG TPA: SigE family RNA polymerase sigma factor [Micromonosporaceae bacterium]|nr:SigE family RNA polymerase sigma factor [Micromonosporaceae bacterium]
MDVRERNARSEFEAFATAEIDGLLRYAVMLTGDRELARDLVQDVMLKAFAQWGRVGSADQPRLYVRKMVTHAFLSWRRRRSVRSVVFDRDGVPSVGSIADHASAVVDHDDVWRRLSRLPRQQRVVLVLRYYERLTDNEIAAVLGCSAGTVRGYASRALATLRLDLAPDPRLTVETS